MRKMYTFHLFKYMQDMRSLSGRPNATKPDKLTMYKIVYNRKLKGLLETASIQRL